ncbi:hypothetical protein GCU49_04620 [Modestobacter roseus]|nr:hypothetical protein [Modestobacter roseus]
MPPRTAATAAATAPARSRGTGTPARLYADATTAQTPAESQTTALGAPVVPPVSSQTWSSGDRSQRGRGAASSACSHGTAPSSWEPGPQRTTVRRLGSRPATSASVPARPSSTSTASAATYPSTWASSVARYR